MTYNSILKNRWEDIREKIIKGIFLSTALLSVITTLGIVIVLLIDSIDFFREVSIFEFLTSGNWNPLIKPTQFGVLPLLSGTLTFTFLTALIALPIGMLAAVVVGIMIVPTIASISEDSMCAVPEKLRLGGFGIGVTKFQVTVTIVIPAARSGIISSFILGVSRAIGETMTELSEKYTIVIVTHNMQQASRVSDYTGFFMVDDAGSGYLVEFDKTQELFLEPKNIEIEDYISGRFG